MDNEALESMTKQGLVVVRAADPSAFQKAADKASGVVRGKVVPAETYDEVKKLVEEAHARSAKK